MKNNLKKIRLEQGLTLKELASRSQVSKAHLHGLENGRSQPKLKMAYVIAAALSMPVQVIWPDDTEVEEVVVKVIRVIS